MTSRGSLRVAIELQLQLPRIGQLTSSPPLERARIPTKPGLVLTRAPSVGPVSSVGLTSPHQKPAPLPRWRPAPARCEPFFTWRQVRLLWQKTIVYFR